MLTKTQVLQQINDKLTKYFSTDIEEASDETLYKAIALVLRDVLINRKKAQNRIVRSNRQKKVYYLCMEFLLGRSLKNNLSNLGMEKSFADALKSYGKSLESLYEIESDAGLGNGGLGRLAACFLDSLASCGYPSMGYSIRYEYGLFKQKIVENTQVELPDIWLDTGEAWMMPRSDKSFKIKLGGRVNEIWKDGKLTVEHVGASIVEAQPYDMIISGIGENVSVLRLWKASNCNDFDMKSFSQGNYMMAMRADNEAELISKVLYPSDDHSEGKMLRLSQQYFLCSASLQDIFNDHKRYYGSLDSLADMAAIHINDTHPALAVPEMMRLLIDEHGYDWDKAWDITSRTIAYTNHTVMAEALEKWSDELFYIKLPRIYGILKEIDRRFRAAALEKCGDYDMVGRMAIFGNGSLRMANLSVIGSHTVNGVSELHSNIIKESVFNDFYKLTPSKFTNVTNGIAHRRWLNQSNPRLAELINELIGQDYYKDASNLEKLLKYADDTSVLKRLDEIKRKNKDDYAKYVKDTCGFVIDPATRIDTQIKRLHEYKRQLLNVLKIIGIYTDLLANPDADITPQTFVFGAKAAGSYYHAKRIISLINCLSQEISRSSKIRSKLNVYFVENYNVTKAEHLIPASEVSEQISLAGKEASGTGNMKFMLNGALTLGTVDGANVEILQNVGKDNIFTFGLLADEVEKLWKKGYYSTCYFADNPKLKEIVDALKVGFGGQSFADIANYLLLGFSYNIADPYMCFADFNDYIRAATELDNAYADKLVWNKMSLINIAKSGVFAADRSIGEYAGRIWNLAVTL